jgi:hypothetical protein
MRDIPGLAEHAVGLKTAAEALYLRELVLSQLEIADSEPDPARRRARTTFVVVGAGYAGTELAAQMGCLTDNLLPDFPALSPADVRWMLLEAADTVMPELGSELGETLLRLLRRRGVDVRVHTSISAVHSESVHLTDGTTIACGTVIWCAGVTASPLVTTLGLPLTRWRVAVTPTLDVADHPEIFVIGDAAAVPDLTSGSEQRLCPPPRSTRCGKRKPQRATSPPEYTARRSVPTSTTTSGWSSTSAARAQSPDHWVSRCAAGRPNWSPAATTCTRCPASAGASACSAPGQWQESAPTTCRSGCWASIKPPQPAASIPRCPSRHTR